MVVPRDELGLLAIGLAVSDSSGWERNREAARDSLDPKDSGRSLARSGRLGGYSLTYRHPHGFASPDEQRPVIVSTEVELFRDDAAASAYLRRQPAIAMRLRGKKLPQGRIAAVERFASGDVGDESEGLRETVVIDDFVGYGTTLGFRRGRIVASVAVLHRQVADGGSRRRAADRRCARRPDRARRGGRDPGGRGEAPLGAVVARRARPEAAHARGREALAPCGAHPSAGTFGRRRRSPTGASTSCAAGGSEARGSSGCAR